VCCRASSRDSTTLPDTAPSIPQPPPFRALTTHTGFLAQQVLPIAPDLVATDANGFYSVNYAGFTPYIVSAIKELSAKIGTEFSNAETATSTSANATSTLPAWAGAFADASDALKQALREFSDAVVQVFSRVIYATAGIFEKLFAGEVHTDKLCMSDSTGETCVTKAQLDALLAAAGESGSSQGDGSPPANQGSDEEGGNETQDTNEAQDTSASAEAVADGEAPVITVNGNNPATIEVGTAYTDLGATVADNVSNNIGITARVDDGEWGEIGSLTLDTSSPATHIVHYRATDAAGNTGTASRTVNVGAPAAEATPVEESPAADTPAETPPAEATPVEAPPAEAPASEGPQA